MLGVLSLERGRASSYTLHANLHHPRLSEVILSLVCPNPLYSTTSYHVLPLMHGLEYNLSLINGDAWSRHSEVPYSLHSFFPFSHINALCLSQTMTLLA